MTNEMSETLRGIQADEAGYQRTKAIIGALDAGMTEEEIDDALAGRAARHDRTPIRCRSCGQTGYAGEYPFSTLGGADTCDDCV